MSPLQVNLAVDPNLDYDSTAYKVAYSRLNGVFIAGEQEAYNNYLRLAEMLPQHRISLLAAARVERRHQRGFQSCGRRMGIKADRGWAEDVFSELRDRFTAAADRGQLVPCLLIQALVVECLAIATYNAYLPVADEFSREVAEAVIQDEYQHLNFGQTWFQEQFETVKADIQAASHSILPIARTILTRMGQDAARLGMDLETLEEEFTIHYGEALEAIGFSFQEVSGMSADGAIAA